MAHVFYGVKSVDGGIGYVVSEEFYVSCRERQPEFAIKIKRLRLTPWSCGRKISRLCCETADLGEREIVQFDEIGSGSVRLRKQVGNK